MGVVGAVGAVGAVDAVIKMICSNRHSMLLANLSFHIRNT